MTQLAHCGVSRLDELSVRPLTHESAFHVLCRVVTHDVHLMPRPLGLANPLGRPPRPSPRPPLPPPAPLVAAVGTRDARGLGFGVENFGVGLDEVGGFSTNEVSVVLYIFPNLLAHLRTGRAGGGLRRESQLDAHECSFAINFRSLLWDSRVAWVRQLSY